MLRLKAHLNGFDLISQHSFNQHQANVGQKSNKSWMNCSNGFNMTQLFWEQRKRHMEARQKFDQIQTWFHFHSTSFQLFSALWRSCLQMDPTLIWNKFVKQNVRQTSKLLISIPSMAKLILSLLSRHFLHVVIRIIVFEISLKTRTGQKDRWSKHQTLFPSRKEGSLRN